jgi:hypothetical protein
MGLLDRLRGTAANSPKNGLLNQLAQDYGLGMSRADVRRLRRLVADQPSGTSRALDWKDLPVSDPEADFMPLGEQFREGIHAGLNAPFGNPRIGLPHRIARPMAGSMAFLSELDPRLALTEGIYDLYNSQDPEYMWETARAALGFVPGFNKVLGIEKLLEEQFPSTGDVSRDAVADAAGAAAAAAVHDTAVMEMIDPSDIASSGMEVHHNIKHALPLKPEIKPGVDPSGAMITAAYDPSMAPAEGGEPMEAEAEPSMVNQILAALGVGSEPAMAQEARVAPKASRLTTPERRMRGLLGDMETHQPGVDPQTLEMIRHNGIDWAVKHGLLGDDTVSRLRAQGYLGAM